MASKNNSGASSNMTNDLSAIYPTESPTVEAIDYMPLSNSIYEKRKK